MREMVAAVRELMRALTSGRDARSEGRLYDIDVRGLRRVTRRPFAFLANIDKHVIFSGLLHPLILVDIDLAYPRFRIAHDVEKCLTMLLSL